MYLCFPAVIRDLLHIELKFFLIRIVQKWVELLTCNMIVDVWSKIFWVYFDNNETKMFKFCKEGPNTWAAPKIMYFSQLPAVKARHHLMQLKQKLDLLFFQVNILPKLSNHLKKTMTIQKGFHHIVFKGQVFVAVEGAGTLTRMKSYFI